MKKVYNYITIVKTEEGTLTIRTNCGQSCNRRNAMDKAHGRSREIIAAVNLEDGTPEKVRDLWSLLLTKCGTWCLRVYEKKGLNGLLDYIETIALVKGYATTCTIYNNPPTRWGY